jgi:penicillin-binding protein 1A
MRPVPAAALGSSETTLLDLTSGYATLVNDARPHIPRLIGEIARDGETIHLNAPRNSEPVLSRQAINGILPMLRGVVLRGTAANAMGSVPVAIAGKTGTTQDHRDAWFMGATPHLALGVWIGRDDNAGMGRGATGGTIAAQVSAEILTAAHAAGLIGSDGLRPDMPPPLVEWPPVMFRGATVVPLNAPAQYTHTPPAPQPEEQVQDYFEIFDGGAHLRPWN